MAKLAGEMPPKQIAPKLHQKISTAPTYLAAWFLFNI
jgi:hypothetical protein